MIWENNERVLKRKENCNSFFVCYDIFFNIYLIYISREIHVMFVWDDEIVMFVNNEYILHLHLQEWGLKRHHLELIGF